MGKRIVSFFMVVLFVFGASIQGFALTSDAPLLTLTEQEKAYFSQLKSLRVLTAPEVQPYSYKNTGVSIDILEHLCESAGVALEVIEAESYEDALTLLENGEAELAAVKISPYGEAVGILPYLDASLQTVHHKQVSPSKQSSLSVAQLQGLDFSYDKKYSFINAITFASVRECLDAVRSRQADIFLCDIYQLSVLSDSFAAWDLTVTTVPRREVTVGFGLRADTDARLISALQSAVDSFSTSELNSSLMRHMQYHEAG